MIVIRPDLSQADQDAIRSNLAAELEKNNGSILSWQLWADKRKLAFILQTRGAKKIRYNEASYILSEIEINPDKVTRIKYILRLDENIFRVLVVKKGDKNG